MDTLHKTKVVDHFTTPKLELSIFLLPWAFQSFPEPLKGPIKTG